jgi:hypothetical protein
VLGFLMRSIYWIIPKKNIIFTWIDPGVSRDFR